MDLWRLAVALLLAVLLAAALGVSAFFVDGEGAGVNLLTEAAGVVVGTAFTVLLIDELRRRRERHDAQSLHKNQLMAEIAHNLSSLVTRDGRGAIARHQLMGRLRQEKPIVADDIQQTVRLDDRQATSLVLALAPMRPLGLRTNTLDGALSTGTYQTVQGGAVEDSQVHLALRRVRDDIERVGALVSASNNDRWSELLSTAAPISRPGNAPCEVPGESLLMAYAFHDLCENLLSEQVALLHYLLGKSEYQAPERQPATPLGAEMEQDLKAEAVSPEEVIQLASREIQPFGDRPPAWAFGRTRDAQLRRFAEFAREMLRRDYGLEVSEADIASAVSAIFDQTFASDDEGIERIDHSRRT